MNEISSAELENALNEEIINQDEYTKMVFFMLQTAFEKNLSKHQRSK